MKFNQVVKSPVVVAPVSLGFGTTWFVGNTTNPGDPQGIGTADIPGSGRSPRAPFPTIAAAISASVAGRGDIIVIQRGTYTENLAVNLAGLTLMAAQTQGYPDEVVISGTMTVTAANCSFYNLEFFSNSANAACVRVGTNTTEVSSTWFENCSFASDGTTEPSYGLMIFGGNDHVLRDCRLIDLTRALTLRSGVTSYISGVRVSGCQFLENTTYDIGTEAGAGESTPLATFGASGGVRNGLFYANVHGRGEVTPTADINIVGTSSGMFANNRLARATNASATSTIPAGLLWVSNMTEAGVSTARPA